MPRKKLIYTHEYPYHIWARSNNREWFYIPSDTLWNIFRRQLNQQVVQHQLMIHSFVLMSNHYHMICTTNKDHPLGSVMQELQKSVSRTINRITGRINHVFGGPYRASLIRNEEHYSNIFKYVHRNPIEAGLCSDVREYRYSTLLRPNHMPLSSPWNGTASLVPPPEKIAFWINQQEEENKYEAIKKGLRKTIYKPVVQRRY